MLPHPQPFRRHRRGARRPRWSRSPTIPASTRSGSRAAAMARTGSPSGRSPASARRRATRPGSAIAMPASCSPASIAPAIANVAHGPMPQDVMRDGGEAAVARALDWLVGAVRGRAGAGPRAGAAPRRLQHHRARHAARHGAGARPCRARPAARGGLRAYVRDRPGAVSPRRQPGDPARRRHAARPRQRRPAQRSGLRRGRGDGRPRTGANATASPFWAAPTSATIRPTRWSRSAFCERAGRSIHRKPAEPWQNTVFRPLIPIAKREDLRSLSGQHKSTGREVWHKVDRADCSVR